MKQFQWKNEDKVLLSNIIYCVTSDIGYSMERLIILEINSQYVLVEGSHCSCYDFDECVWDATEFENIKEFKKFLCLEDWGLRKKAINFMNYYSREFRKINTEDF